MALPSLWKCKHSFIRGALHWALHWHCIAIKYTCCMHWWLNSVSTEPRLMSQWHWQTLESKERRIRLNVTFFKMSRWFEFTKTVVWVEDNSLEVFGEAPEVLDFVSQIPSPSPGNTLPSGRHVFDCNTMRAASSAGRAGAWHGWTSVGLWAGWLG